MGVQNITTSSPVDWGSTGTDDSTIAAVRQGEDPRQPANASNGDTAADDTPSATADRSESRVDGSAMRAVIDSMTRRSASPAAPISPADRAAGETDPPEGGQQTDPRFD